MTQADEMELIFPPLMYGEAAHGDAFDHACARAIQGCDAGLIAHVIGTDELQAAMVFAPEMPLADAVIALPVCAVGFQNALGALAPPEVAVHLEWHGAVRINGARCGGFRMAAAPTNPGEEPGWLVVGLTVPLWPAADAVPGDTPDETVLYAEGCVDVQAPLLLEAWARHTLNWLGRWQEDGIKPVHGEWRGLAHGIGEAINHAGRTGTFVGIDERFGLLFRDGDTTDLIPLTALLETP